MHFHTYPDVLIPQVEGHGLITRPLLAHIGGREIQLGWTVTHFATMQLDGSRPPLQHEDHLDFWAVPGDDDTVTSRYTGRDDISRPATST